MKSIVKNYRQSPRKVRLVANLLSGKTPEQAENILTFSPQRAAVAVLKAVRSAVANAKNNFSVDPKSITIKSVRVDEGEALHRYRARFGGRATPIKKRSSHISVLLSTDGEVKKPSQKTKKTKQTKATETAEFKKSGPTSFPGSDNTPHTDITKQNPAKDLPHHHTAMQRKTPAPKNPN